MLTDDIYYGPRNDVFKKLIYKLLEKGKLKPKYLNILTNDTNMELFGKAFTSPTADSLNNYEMYEQLGDLSANKFIVWYVYKRFPQLRCSKGVKIAARLRINYGSKQSFYEIAETYGFWDFITASVEQRQHKKKPLMEDALEAFIGCTETILDDMFQPGVGYGVVYDILKSIFDDINISLSYNDLYDPKTRLKELYDMYTDTLGKIVYIDSRQEQLAISSVYQVTPNLRDEPLKIKIGPGKKDIQLNPQSGWVLIGVGKAAIKPDAQKRAAELGLHYMNSRGYSKPIPEEYSMFCS
jgi:dsRNA-specific ribonuclease